MEQDVTKEMLKAFRAKNKITQTTLAYHMGMTTSKISEWETGAKPINQKRMQLLINSNGSEWDFSPLTFAYTDAAEQEQVTVQASDASTEEVQHDLKLDMEIILRQMELMRMEIDRMCARLSNEP